MYRELRVGPCSLIFAVALLFAGILAGCGGPADTTVTHTFDGDHYVEGERVSADTAPEGTRALAGDFTFEGGIPLELRD